MSSHLFTIAFCVWLLAVYAGMAHLEEQPDRRGDHTRALQIEQRYQAEELAKKQNEIARFVCGNAHYEWLDNRTIKCVPRHGNKAHIVKL